MKICIKERNNNEENGAPVIKLQLVSGYTLDKKYLMQSLLLQRSSLINHFRVYGRDAYLYLKFLNDPKRNRDLFDM